ncbi:MBL fold metallo-hydrolase [Psychromarinibacter sp. S121]|uniref:MBL fold metallo-hydrolase n=1 Tax=Psychromarinibacter sp. S121 TaxID=3415127 RepID=UPI003C7E6FAD
MKLTCLGTGTPGPSARRVSSGYWLRTADRSVVIDHGGGAHQRFIEAGGVPGEITDLLLTHLHSDHALDVPRLVMTRWDQQSDAPALRVYGPPPVAQFLDRLFGSEGAFRPDIIARREHPASLAIFAARGGKGVRPPLAYEVTEVAAGDGFQLGEVAVTVGHAQHFAPHLSCLGYRFRSGDADLTYTGDTGYCAEVVDFAKGTDVMITMCQYLHGTPLPDAARATAASHLEAARMAEEAGVGTLVLSHLSEQFDDPLLRARAQQEMLAVYGGRIVWAEDGMTLDLSPDATVGRFD